MAAGAATGPVFVVLTRSGFILSIALAGFLGAYFYAASLIRLGYRGMRDIVIGLLFGILPVYGSYVLQTRSVDPLPLLPVQGTGMALPQRRVLW